MAKIELSPEQLDAAHLLDRNVALSAGAGTGKTSTLVERFVAALESGAEVFEIAAITFTEKAANELKGRLYERLRELAGQEDRTVPKRRRRAALVGLETAQIGTIHSFCTGILREFSLQAGMDPAFSVMEEFESGLILSAAVRDALFDAVTRGEPEAQRLLGLFEFNRLCEILETAAGARADMSRIRKALPLDAGPSTLAAALKAEARKASFEQMIEAVFSMEFQNLMSRLETQEGPSGDLIEGKRRALLAGYERLRQSDAAEAPGIIASMYEAVESLSGGSKRGWDGSLDEVKETMKGARAVLAPLMKGSGRIDEENWTQRAGEMLDFMRLYDEALSEYTARKRRLGKLDFDDLIMCARDLVASNEAVANALGRRYRFILVDEFQDTDFVQAELIQAIAAGGAKLFVVGDREQSIYSFRGARAEVFSRLIADYEERGLGVVKKLSVNRRSVAHILDFVNVLFGRLMPAGSTRDLRPSHQPLSPLRRGKSNRIEFLVAVSGEGIDYSRRIEAQQIARRIGEIVNSKVPTVEDPAGSGAWRAAHYGDFAVLLRSMSSVDIYERELVAAGIPCYTIAGSTFYIRQEVKDLVNLLRFLIDPGDSLSLVGALRSPLFGVSDDLLATLTEERPLPDYFGGAEIPGDSSDAEALRRAAGLVGRLRALANRVPVREIIDATLAETGFAAAVAMLYGGRQRVANVLKLRQAAFIFDASAAGTLEDFVRTLSVLEVGEARESEALVEDEKNPVVRLMTVHNAKGLEFPIVIVADMGRDRNVGGAQGSGVVIERRLGVALPVEGCRDSAYYQIARNSLKGSESDEEKRILFVAATRARDHLILSGSASGRQGAMPDAAGGWAGQGMEALGISLDAPRDYKFDNVTVEFSRPASIAPSRRGRKPAILTLRDRLISGGAPAGRAHPDADDTARRCRPLGPSALSRTRFTATQLADFSRCALRYELLHLRGLPADFALADRLEPTRPPAHIVGLVLHEVLEKVRRRETLSAALDRVLQTNPAYAGAAGLLRNECAPVLERMETSEFYRRITSATEARRERQFSFLFEGYLLEGTIDLSLAGGIVDFKSDDVPGDETAQHAEAYRSQMDVYALAHERLTGTAPESVTVCFLRPGREVVWKYGPRGIAAAESRVRRTIADITEGPPYPVSARDSCKCEYGTLCSLILERRSSR